MRNSPPRFFIYANSHIYRSIDHYPAEDEKLRASNLTRRRGGNCPNTLEVLQQLVNLGEDTALPLVLCSVLSSERSVGAQQIKSSFGPAVDLTHCIHRETHDEPASSYIIRSKTTDSRTIVNYNGLPEMTTIEFMAVADDLGHRMSWCHFEVGRLHSSPDIKLG